MWHVSNLWAVTYSVIMNVDANMQVYFCALVSLYYYHLYFLVCSSYDSKLLPPSEIGVCVLQYLGTHNPQYSFSRIIITEVTAKFNCPVTSESHSIFSFISVKGFCLAVCLERYYHFLAVLFHISVSIHLFPLFCCLSRMFVMKQLLIIMICSCEWLSLNISYIITFRCIRPHNKFTCIFSVHSS
jgi:hypothetical protein